MSIRTALRTAVDEFRGYWQGPYSLANPNVPLSTSLFHDGYRNSSGVTVTEETALRYSAVWSAVTQISQTVGSLPIGLYKKQGNTRTEFTNHAIHRVLNYPNPETSSMVFRETLMAHLLLYGNCYAEIQWGGGGEPTAIWQLHPGRVTPFRAEIGGGRLGAVQYRVDGQRIVNAENIIHVPGLSGDGILGYSVIAQAAQNMGLSLAAEQFGASFFGNGSTFGGILTHPGKLGKDAKQGIRESIETSHQGSSRAHKFIVLGEGMTYTPIGIPPNAAQFIETRRFGTEDVARWFNMPPHMLKDLDRSTNNNIEHQSIEFVMHTIRPWCERLEQEFKRKLVAASERYIQYVKINIDGLLRGDIQARYTAYGIGRDKGWLSADDIRALEDLNPLPDGQGTLYLVQQAQVPVSKIEDLIQSEIDKNRMPKTVAPPPGGQRDDELDALRKEIADLKQSNAEHRQAVETIVASVRDLHTVPNDLREQIAAHHETIRAQEQEIATKQTLLLLATERADKAERERDERSGQRDEAITRAETAETQITAAEAEILHLREAVKTAQDELDQAVARADNAERLAGVAEIARGEAAKRAEDAERQAIAAATALTDAETTFKAVRADATASAKALAEAEKAALEAYRVRDLAEAGALLAQGAAKTAADDANQARQDALQAQQDAEAALKAGAEAEARCVTAEAAGQAALDAVQAQRAATAERYTRMVGAIRGMVVDVWGRMVRREIEKARRNLGTPAKLRAWAEGFYLLHGDTCIDALRPVIAAHLAWLGSDADVDDTTRELVGPHLKTAERQLRAIADGDPDEYHTALERLLTKWETDRPNALADVILREGIAHVRTL